MDTDRAMVTDEIPWDNAPSLLDVAGLQNYFYYGADPGGFLNAVLCGDLYGAASKADVTNRELIGHYARFIGTWFPLGAYGSPEKVLKWRSSRCFGNVRWPEATVWSGVDASGKNVFIQKPHTRPGQ